jgi:hypothetical protein
VGHRPDFQLQQAFLMRVYFRADGDQLDRLLRLMEWGSCSPPVQLGEADSVF